MPDNDDLELAIEELDETVAKPSKLKKLLLIGVPTLILLVGGAAAYFFMFTSSDKSVQTTELAAETSTLKAKAEYFAIEPEFMVNLIGENNHSHYLRIKISLMTRDAAMLDQFTEHLPLMKNDLLALFSSQSYENLKSIEGKQKLRKDALTTVQTLLKKQGAEGTVEAALFTNFVME